MPLTVVFNEGAGLTTVRQEMLVLPISVAFLDTLKKNLQEKSQSLGLLGEIIRSADSRFFDVSLKDTHKTRLAGEYNEPSHPGSAIYQAGHKDDQIIVLQNVEEITDALITGKTDLHGANLLPSIIARRSADFCAKLEKSALKALDKMAADLQGKAIDALRL